MMERLQSHQQLTHIEKKHNLSSTRTSTALCVNSLWKYSEVQALNYLQSLQKTILFLSPIQKQKCNGPLEDLKSETPVNCQFPQNDSAVDLPSLIFLKFWIGYFSKFFYFAIVRYSPNWSNPCFSSICQSFSLCSTTLKWRLMNNSFPLLETNFHWIPWIQWIW